jgi:uncharacterized protein (DUF2062 family)
MINRDRIRQRAKEILSLDSHPAHIAAAFSAGVFISFTPPIPGLHTTLAVAVAFLLRLNKVACLAGSWVNTPLTVIPSLIFSYKLGARLLGCPATKLHLRAHGADWGYLKMVLVQHAKPLLLGCSLVGFVAAVAAYFACYWMVVLTRRRDEGLDELTREMEEVGDELE